MLFESRSVPCPVCGAPSTITLTEDRDPRRESEGHEIGFTCSAGRHTVPDSELLKVWALSGRRQQSPEPTG